MACPLGYGCYASFSIPPSCFISLQVRHVLNTSSCQPFITRTKYRTLKISALGNSDLNPLDDDSFWEQPEGKEKMQEIEDLRELIADAEKLQTGSSEDASSQASKAEELREELAKRARDQAERRKEAEKMFQIGQQAYGKGMYEKSVEFFEAALTNIHGSTNLGGEIQIWLAMAYEAHNRHNDCISLYKRLEKTHPNTSVRRQAKNLRYILEAPRLKISKEEMVTIPLINQYNDSDSRTWSQIYRERRRKNIAKKIPQSRDYLADWLVWNPPRWERSPYFWVAVTVWLTLVGVSLMFQD